MTSLWFPGREEEGGDARDNLSGSLEVEDGLRVSQVCSQSRSYVGTTLGQWRVGELVRLLVWLMESKSEGHHTMSFMHPFPRGSESRKGGATEGSHGPGSSESRV